MLPFIECGQASWLGALEWDFSQNWLDLVKLMLHWDSKPSIFPHPHYPRCNHWPNTNQPCHFSNSWPFGEIWDEIGPPRGFDANLEILGFLLTIGFQSHSNHSWCIYKPINRNFRFRQYKNYLVSNYHCVQFNCNLMVFYESCTQIWFVNFTNTPRFSCG